MNSRKASRNSGTSNHDNQELDGTPKIGPHREKLMMFSPRETQPLSVRYSVQLLDKFDFGTIFGDTLRMIRDSYRDLLRILILIELPLLILQSELLPAVNTDMMDVAQWGRLLIAALVFGVLNLFVTTNVYVTASDLSLNTRRPFLSVFSRAIVLYPEVVIASAVIYVVSAVGLLALIIPGVIVYIFSRCVIPLLVIRRQSIFASLVGSYELIKGHWFHVLIIELSVIAAAMLVGFLIFPVYAAASMLQDSFVVKLFGDLIGAAFGIASSLVTVSMFFNLESVQRHKQGRETAVWNNEQSPNGQDRE
jgi:hypothetical protein